MWLLLVCGALGKTSGVMSLNKVNFDEIVHGKARHPVFLKAYHPFCPHCQEFQSVWQPFCSAWRAKNSEVKLAEIDCMEQGKLCRSLPCSGYPCLLWFDGIHSEPVVSELVSDPDELMELVGRLTSGPVKILNAASDASKFDDKKLVFLMNYRSLNEKQCPVFVELAKKMQGSDVVFAMARGHEAKVDCYVYGTKVGSAELKSGIKQFVQQQIDSILSTLDRERYSMLSNERKPCYVIVCREGDDPAMYRDVVRLLVSVGKTMKISADSDLLRELLGSNVETPQIMELVNGRVVRTFQGTMNEREVGQWLNIARYGNSGLGIVTTVVLLLIIGSCIWMVRKRFQVKRPAWAQRPMIYDHVAFDSVPCDEGPVL